MAPGGVTEDDADRGDDVSQGQREPHHHGHRPASGAGPRAVHQPEHRHHQHLGSGDQGY